MANHVDTLTAGRPAPPARPRVITHARPSRRFLIDRLARRLVTLGGLAIIVSILAILAVIAAEVYPLLEAPTAVPVRQPVQTGAAPLAVGVDEYRQVASLLTTTGVRFVSIEDTATLGLAALPDLGGASVVAVSMPGRGGLALGLSDGRVLPLEIRFTVSHTEGSRVVHGEAVWSDLVSADPAGRPIRHVAYARAESSHVIAAAAAPTELAVVTIKETKALIGPSRREESRQALVLPLDGEVRALALDARGEDLFVGTAAGEVLRVDLRDPTARVAESVPATSSLGAAVSTLGLLLGDRTLIVGDAAGGVSSWQVSRSQAGPRRLRKIHDFAPHAAPVVGLASSGRDKGFISADASGLVQLHYGTTGQTLLQIQALVCCP